MKLSPSHVRAESHPLTGIDFGSLHINPFLLSAGALKLSGCNIFGRMYRLNTVIRELSDECTLCRCTGAGVNCTPTGC